MLILLNRGNVSTVAYGCVYLKLNSDNNKVLSNLHSHFWGVLLNISGSTNSQLSNSVADPAAVYGARNMKSMQLPLAIIFFMTYFYRGRGAWPPWPPPGSATVITKLSE